MFICSTTRKTTNAGCVAREHVRGGGRRFRGVDALVLVAEAHRSASFARHSDALGALLDDAAAAGLGERVPRVLLLAKADLGRPDDRASREQAEAARVWAQRRGAAFLETSAMSGDNVAGGGERALFARCSLFFDQAAFSTTACRFGCDGPRLLTNSLCFGFFSLRAWATTASVSRVFPQNNSCVIARSVLIAAFASRSADLKRRWLAPRWGRSSAGRWLAERRRIGAFVVYPWFWRRVRAQHDSSCSHGASAAFELAEIVSGVAGGNESELFVQHKVRTCA